MYESGVNSEGDVDCDLLFCQACLSSNRVLTTVGDYIDIFLKICDNSRLNKTSQVNICWECMALLKKVRAFKKKVENAQKILDYCINKQAPLEDSLSNLTSSNTELTTFVPILIPDDDDDDEYPDDNHIKTHTHTHSPKDLDKSLEKIDSDPKDDVNKSIVIDLDDYDDPNDEMMIKIADVRGQCDIDGNPVLNSSTPPDIYTNVTVKMEPLSPEEDEEQQRYQRWKRSAILVYKRICGHRYARYFLRPVSDELAPCYSRVVRRPADLVTIKRRIRDGDIRTTKEFRHALLLMFCNALMYNGSEYNIYHMTMELRDETLLELEILEAAEAHANSPLFPVPPPPRRRAPSPPPPPPPPPHPLRARPVSPPTLPPSILIPASLPPRRRRWDWSNWPEHEHLVAIKKYKTTVVPL